MIMKKLVAIGVIFLFIGVAVAPSINSNVVKASDDNDLVEVTSQACGISGFGNTTVKLTKEQYQNLEQYLVDFRARLNQTTTRDEAVPIFKDAVVELNKYGLLPKGMSVEKAQKFVVGENLNPRVIKSLQKVAHELNDSKRIINLFCLFEASGGTSVDLNLYLILIYGLGLLYNIINHYPLIYLTALFQILILYSQLKPVRFANLVKLYICQLSTFGLLGKIKYDEIYNVHVAFFTGLKIKTSYYPLGKGTYLGYAGVVYHSI
jgi:hypothetical protein